MRTTKRAIEMGRLYGPEAKQREEERQSYRRLHKVKQPRLNKYPRWLKREQPFKEALQSSLELWDHVGTIDNWLVCEPYGHLNPERVERLGRAIADEFGMEFYFSPISWWYPGKTVRLMWRPQHECV